MENAQSEMSRYERKRLEREQKEQARKMARRKKKLVRWGVLTFVLMGVVGGFILLGRSTGRNVKELPNIKEFLGEQFPDIGRGHVQAVNLTDYNSVPPTSGSHFGAQTNWGIHQEPVPEGYQIHNLEHGGVIMHYKPLQSDISGDDEVDTPTSINSELQSASSSPTTKSSEGISEDIIEKLKAIGEDYRWNKLMLTPAPSLDANIALTAWTHLDKFDEFDEDRIRAFIDAYRNRGPENVSNNMQSVELP